MQQIEAVTLSQLGAYIKQLVSDANISTWIVAEIHSISVSKHCYIECVEKSEQHGDIVARMKFNIWGNVANTLLSNFESETGQQLQAGLKIMFFATISYHELYGISGTISAINPEYTLGALERQRRDTIRRLTEDGVVDMNKMFELPLALQNIAIVSSDMAAGYGDFCNQILNNAYNLSFNLKLYPAMVQGADAPQSIISALDAIAAEPTLPDVVVLIRGGGSKADLLCFDNYDLACNIAQFPCPVITGIGHERDNSVCDIVAHTRTKTPTAAAEFIVGHNLLLLERIVALRTRLYETSQDILALMRRRTDNMQMQLISSTQGRVGATMQYVDRLYTQLKLTTQNNLRAQILHIKQLKLSLQQLSYKLIRDQGNNISTLQRIIAIYAPTDTLRRGFTITTLNGKRITNASDVSKGDVLTTITHNGKIISVVERVL